MNNAVPLFKSLIIYGACLPLAIFIGYQLATPLDLSSLGVISLVIMVMAIPLLLRWHYPLLVISYNVAAGLYFLPGQPSLFLVMSFLSLGISFLSYILDRDLKFIPVPGMTKPILFLAAVVLITAKFTGGIGLGSLGSNTAGGKHYIFLLAGIVGFYALTARRIPVEKTGLYTNLFFLSAMTGIVGNLVVYINPAFYFIYYIFPADLAGLNLNTYGEGITSSAITRLGGVSLACVCTAYALMARFGLKGLFEPKKQWRLILFFCVFILSLFGGFRSKLIEISLTCMILFWLEGLMRSRLLPALLLMAVLVGAVVVPFAGRLPLSVQRSLAFLPLDLSYDATANANDSVEWRLQMWRDVIPTIPQYLLLGKGYAIDAHDLEMWVEGMNAGVHDSYGSAMAGDYHNGPLSVIIPFGIFGVIGFLWILWAEFKLLQRNYLYGDEAHQIINRFLLTAFLVRIFMFIFIMGGLYSDLGGIIGLAGFSVALNGGVRSPVSVPVNPYVFKKLRLVSVTQ